MITLNGNVLIVRNDDVYATIEVVLVRGIVPSEYIMVHTGDESKFQVDADRHVRISHSDGTQTLVRFVRLILIKRLDLLTADPPIRQAFVPVHGHFVAVDTCDLADDIRKWFLGMGEHFMIINGIFAGYDPQRYALNKGGARI